MPSTALVLPKCRRRLSTLTSIFRARTNAVDHAVASVLRRRRQWVFQERTLFDDGHVTAWSNVIVGPLAKLIERVLPRLHVQVVQQPATFNGVLTRWLAQFERSLLAGSQVGRLGNSPVFVRQMQRLEIDTQAVDDRDLAVLVVAKDQA